MTTSPESESSEPVGSSAKTTRGRCTSARATATRWPSPPESSPGRFPAASTQVEQSSHVAASTQRARRRDVPPSMSGSAMFSAARAARARAGRTGRRSRTRCAAARFGPPRPSRRPGGPRIRPRRRQDAGSRRRSEAAWTSPTRWGRRSATTSPGRRPTGGAVEGDGAPEPLLEDRSPRACRRLYTRCIHGGKSSPEPAARGVSPRCRSRPSPAAPGLCAARSADPGWNRRRRAAARRPPGRWAGTSGRTARSGRGAGRRASDSA